MPQLVSFKRQPARNTRQLALCVFEQHGMEKPGAHTMSNDQILVAAFLSGYLQALSDVERDLRDEPFFRTIEREVAIESITNNRNTKRIAVLAASYAASAGTQAEVR